MTAIKLPMMMGNRTRVTREAWEPVQSSQRSPPTVCPVKSALRGPGVSTPATQVARGSPTTRTVHRERSAGAWQ